MRLIFLHKILKLLKGLGHKTKLFLLKGYVKSLNLGFNSKIPQYNLVLGYLSYIIIGFILLSLPFAQNQDISFWDNLFTITSAVSTTGLATIDIPHAYSFWGELIILFFIQLGGIGYMTLTSYLMYNTTRHFILRKQKTIETSFSIPQELDLVSIIHSAIRFTLLFEILGAISLYICFSLAGVDHALWNAIFHSISSFCTAGFSLFDGSMVQFNTNIGVNLTITILSYAGAMGFIFMTDLWRKLTLKKHKLTLTSKVILFITISTTLIGSVWVYNNLPDTFYHNSTFERVVISVFQTMSAMTTVGFNTIDLSALKFVPIFVLMLTMFIGASPSGTGGGVKSTTLSAVFAFLKSRLSEKTGYFIGKNRIPTFRVQSALTSFIFYQLLLLGGIMALIITEQSNFEAIMFEAVSALGTVGLSLGITPSLSIPGKLIIILLMYIGRLGPLAFGSFLLTRMKNKSKRFQEKESDLAI